MIGSFFRCIVSVHLHKRHVRRAALLTSVATLAFLALPLGCKGAFDEQAAAQWKQARGTATIAVLPTMVRVGKSNEYDIDTAAVAASWLNEQTLGAASARTEQVPIPGSWHTDQSRMFRESGAAIGEFRRKNAIDADYTLMVECLFFAKQGGGKGELIGVHLYLVDREGRFADGILLNSHYPLFNERAPKTAAECVDLALTAWKRETK